MTAADDSDEAFLTSLETMAHENFAPTRPGLSTFRHIARTAKADRLGEVHPVV